MEGGIMADILTNEDKMAIANSHKRSLESDKYNLELSILEENAVSNPSAQIVAELQSKLNQSAAKIAALDAEIASLTE
jgi:hypothetical protein